MYLNEILLLSSYVFVAYNCKYYYYVIIWKLHCTCHIYDCCIVSQEETYRLKEMIKQIMLNTKCYVNACPICDCCSGCSYCVCVCVCVCVIVIMKSARDSAYTDSITVTVLLM